MPKNSVTIGNTPTVTISNTSEMPVALAGVVAARAGNGVCGKLNAKTGINSQTTLTDSGFLYAVPSGERLIVTGFYTHLNTASDYCDFEFGTTPDASGTGTFTPLTPKFRIETGTANQAEYATQTILPVPIVVDYDDAKAFTARVTANDANASLTIAFSGWHEET